MGKILSFPGRLTLEEALSMDVEEMSREEMLALIPKIEDLYDDMQEDEPEDTESEEYISWADDMEALDDLLDEIQDRLEE